MSRGTVPIQTCDSSLKAELREATRSYSMVWPPPFELSENLRLACRFAGALEAAEAEIFRLRDRQESADLANAAIAWKRRALTAEAKLREQAVE